MKVISWHISGINSPNKHRMLKRKIQQEKPTILMLQETKSNSDKLDNLMSKLWWGNRSIFVDSVRASGGLTISWNPVEVVLDNFMASHHSISTHFHPIGTNMHGRITNVYGPQLSDQKL